MKLDHISYAASHDQLIDVVQRIGSQIGSPFVDGGIHPGFGTRNFTLPLANGLYLEVVCPLNHPAADRTPFGKMVTHRVNDGGGWMSWVVATPNIELLEKQLSRKSISGHRKKPDGTDLRWKQIGVLDTLEDGQLPFFIEWETENHPSDDGIPVASIKRIEMCGDKKVVENFLGQSPNTFLNDIELVWISNDTDLVTNGIIAVQLETDNGLIRIE